MNNDDYKEALFYAASIFNERLGQSSVRTTLYCAAFRRKISRKSLSSSASSISLTG